MDINLEKLKQEVHDAATAYFGLAASGPGFGARLDEIFDGCYTKAADAEQAPATTTEPWQEPTPPAS